MKRVQIGYLMTAVLLALLLCAAVGCGRAEQPIPGSTAEETETVPETESSPASTVGPSPLATEPAGTETAPVTLPAETLPAETEKPQTPVSALGFLADLTDYEEYMNPTGDKRDAFLLLVNPDHPLASEYVPEQLTDVSGTRKDGRTVQKMSLYAAKALEALFLDADANGMVNTSTGYALSVTSAYRSYSYQDSLFSTYLAQTFEKHPDWSKERAEADVMTYSCRPGTSEHQSGLCCDMHNQAAASASHPERFTGTKEMQWLLANSWKYGFILRFPSDKEDVTGIKFEPWHFRYVGRYHAERMTELGMCLEEYVDYLSRS